jgi:hypothetical protein
MNGPRKVIGKATMVAIAVGIVVGGAGVGQANAATVSNSGHCWGAVTYSRAVGTYLYGDIVLVDPFVVGRSGCFTGTQVATVLWREFGYDPSRGWVLDRSESRSVTLQPGQYGTVPINSGGTFARHINVAVDATITWRSGTGQFIGQTYLNYNSMSDYFCATASGGYRHCTVAWATGIGAYIHFV